MPTVAVNPPKTPVTKGSNGMATATLPNMCKMPPPPPPFCPTPLPNIGMSGKNPQKYSTTVQIEGNPVAIQGSTFDSVGDIASKATGGGVVSNNAEGPTAFVAPGSLDVKIEGKNVQFLGDQMLNNCGPAGSPANSATMAGEMQLIAAVMFPEQAGNNPTECSGQAGHSWVCEEAKGPTGVRQKIADASASARKGTQFEAAAATHNQKSGDLTRGSQLSGNAEEDKVFWVCSVCGMKREGDQVHDDPNGGPPIAVEVKSKGALSVADARQLGRNLQAVTQGGASGLIYKVPASSAGDFLGSQVQKLGKLVDVAVRIIKV